MDADYPANGVPFPRLFTAFLPMQVMAAPDGPAAPPPGDAAAEPEPRIEIVLPDGTALRVNETVGAAVLQYPSGEYRLPRRG